MRPNRIPIRVAACLAGLVALAHTAAAQNAVPLQYGARVRVVALGRDDQQNRVLEAGWLQGLDGDTIVISSGGTLQRLVVDSSRGLEVSYKSRRHTGPGALMGFAVGGFLGYVAPCDDSGGSFAPTCDSMRPVAAVLLGAIGAGVGALIGANVVTDYWRPLRRPWKVAVNPRLPGQVVVRLSIRR